MAVRFHDAVTPFLRPIEELQQHPDNPNNGDVDAIAESILINGFYSVCIAQASTRYLLSGNHRYAALLSLGEVSIPVVYLNISDDEALGILLGDNEIASKAVRDEHQVLELLKGLQERGYSIQGAGYDDDAMRALVTKVRAREHIPLPDDISTVTTPMRARVYIDGFLDGDDYIPFDFGDIPDTIIRLRDLGYRAIGMEGR